jgi:hypothetical protein
VVLYFGHVALTVVAFESFIKHGAARDSMSNLFPAWILSDALPFILWAIIANDLLRQGAAQLFRSKPSPPKQTHD